MLVNYVTRSNFSCNINALLVNQHHLLSASALVHGEVYAQTGSRSISRFKHESAVYSLMLSTVVGIFI